MMTDDQISRTALGDVVLVGTTGTVTIERLNDDGDGVGKLQGWTMFVPLALPGESVDIEVAEVHKRHLVGRLLGHTAGTSKSPLRVNPPAGVHAADGGCPLQHISYEGQLLHKRNVVMQALARIGKLENITVNPTLGMDIPWRYRNQIQVPLAYNPESKTLVPGFFAAGSHDIVPSDTFPLAPVSMEQTVRFVVDTLCSILGTAAQLVHHVIVRHSVYTDEQMVILCLRQDVAEDRRPARPDTARDSRPAKQPDAASGSTNGLTLSRRTLTDLGQALLKSPVVSVSYTVQPRETGPVWGPTVTLLCGQAELTERIGDIEFFISPRSFFQVNTQQAQVLCHLVRDFADLRGNETVLDAYCGTGTFGLTLARAAGHVIGVEEVRPAVLDARRNAARNHIDNADFEVGQTEQILPKWTKSGKRFDVAVLDPPRKGCHPDVLSALAAARPPRIIYVSCNPATLARDLRILVDAGYAVDKVQPVDMFPQTSHVECVVATHYVGKK